MTEVEGRWNLLEKWAILGFAGKGATDGDNEAFDTEDNIVAGGVGARYLLMDDLGLWIGLDYAVGPEEQTAYIQVGHAW